MPEQSEHEGVVENSDMPKEPVLTPQDLERMLDEHGNPRITTTEVAPPDSSREQIEEDGQ